MVSLYFVSVIVWCTDYGTVIWISKFWKTLDQNVILSVIKFFSFSYIHFIYRIKYTHCIWYEFLFLYWSINNLFINCHDCSLIQYLFIYFFLEFFDSIIKFSAKLWVHWVNWIEVWNTRYKSQNCNFHWCLCFFSCFQFIFSWFASTSQWSSWWLRILIVFFHTLKINGTINRKQHFFFFSSVQTGVCINEITRYSHLQYLNIDI